MEVDAAPAVSLQPKAPVLKPVAPDANFVDDDELQVPYPSARLPLLSAVVLTPRRFPILATRLRWRAHGGWPRA